MEKNLLWIPIIVLAALACALLWYTAVSRRRIDELRQQSRERLGELETSHDRRVARLKRKVSEHKERGHLELVRDLLPALDALDGALQEASRDGESGALLQGLEMVERELDTVLGRHGIEKCCPQPGDRFDPNVHEALSIVDDGEFPDGQITDCYRPGYRHGERVLRPAAVSVARAAVSEQADAEQADDEQTEQEAVADSDEPEDDEPAQRETSRPETDSPGVVDSSDSPEGSPSTRG
ncbi:MAG: nucleotide exchange factor GrpE [Persicimonas sp.]